MSVLFPLPAELQQVDYAQLYFHLEVDNYFDLPPLGLLQLRRELAQALKSLQPTLDPLLTLQLKELLHPSLADPLLRKQFKQPAPGFVLAPDPARQGLFQPKERIVLPVLLIGSVLTKFNLLVQLFDQLGRQGLYHGTGQFRLAALESEDATGQRSIFWRAGETWTALQFPVSDLRWWLEMQPQLALQAEIELITPMRLQSRGKPLFQVDFAIFFPFLLRRVTAMLACHAGVEPVVDPAGLIARAGQVKTIVNRLRWTDWRQLNGIERQQDLGGLLGSLQVAGPALPDLAWLLHLGRLLHLGKGAAYGTGRYLLRNL